MKCLLGTRGDSQFLWFVLTYSDLLPWVAAWSRNRSLAARDAFKACCGGGMEVVVSCAILTLGFCGGSAVAVRDILTGTYFALVDAAALCKGGEEYRHLHHCLMRVSVLMMEGSSWVPDCFPLHDILSWP